MLNIAHTILTPILTKYNINNSTSNTEKKLNNFYDTAINRRELVHNLKIQDDGWPPYWICEFSKYNIADEILQQIRKTKNVVILSATKPKF